MQLCLSARILLAVLVCASGYLPAYGGGYLAVDNAGNPYKWQGPVTLNLDLGPLGILSNEQADAIVLEGVSKWTPTYINHSTVSFLQGPDLSEDHGDGVGSDPGFDLLTTATDGLTAVIYDQFGTFTEMLGNGMSNSVVGFAGPVLPDDLSPAAITEGIVVLNGKFIDGLYNTGTGAEANPADKSVEEIKGTVTHEVGHLLNLGHSQAGLAFSETGFDVGNLPGFPYDPRREPDYRGVPTMFPVVFPDIGTLELDDKSWILNLYADSEASSYGSIAGSIRTQTNDPQIGINVVAYSADDPTSMVTCMSGFSDFDKDNAPSGNYLIPSLPPGTNWILDVEPMLDYFLQSGSMGITTDSLVMPGPPEFINENAFETNDDSGFVSTTFNIPTAPTGRNLQNVDLHFNDLDDVQIITEQDFGTDEETGQIVPAMPGSYVLINGVIDPAEPNPQDLSYYGMYYDFYRVVCPGGMELNQVFLDSQGSVLDVMILEKKLDNDAYTITSTASGLGLSSLPLYIDSTRVGEGPYTGVFYFSVGYTHPFLGGSTPYELSNYTLGLLFSVSDRDGVVVKDTVGGGLNVTDTVVRLVGRGFKNLGGAPEVVFETPGVTVNSVSFINANTLDVNVTGLDTLLPGTQFPVQVKNQPASGGFAGRRIMKVNGETMINDWGLY